MEAVEKLSAWGRGMEFLFILSPRLLGGDAFGGGNSFKSRQCSDIDTLPIRSFPAVMSWSVLLGGVRDTRRERVAAFAGVAASPGLAADLLDSPVARSGRLIGKDVQRLSSRILLIGCFSFLNHMLPDPQTL